MILDDEVLKAIDDKVGQRGRSRLLEEAATERLERVALEAAICEGAGMLEDEDDVNLAEIEVGLRQRERRKSEALLGHVRCLVTTPAAPHRAGRYQAEWARRGRTIETPVATCEEGPGPAVRVFAGQLREGSRLWRARAER